MPPFITRGPKLHTPGSLEMVVTSNYAAANPGIPLTKYYYCVQFRLLAPGNGRAALQRMPIPCLVNCKARPSAVRA